jgi:hypothetical protein
MLAVEEKKGELSNTIFGTYATLSSEYAYDRRRKKNGYFVFIYLSIAGKKNGDIGGLKSKK